MWGADQPCITENAVCGVGRLHRKDIQPDRRQLSGFQAFGQHVKALDHAAPGGVHDHCSRAHLGNSVTVNETFCFRGERDMQRYEVRTLEQFMQADNLNEVWNSARRTEKWVVTEDRHVKCFRQLGNLPADTSQSDYTEGMLCKISGRQLVATFP